MFCLLRYDLRSPLVEIQGTLTVLNYTSDILHLHVFHWHISVRLHPTTCDKSMYWQVHWWSARSPDPFLYWTLTQCWTTGTWRPVPTVWACSALNPCLYLGLWTVDGWNTPHWYSTSNVPILKTEIATGSDGITVLLHFCYFVSKCSYA